MFRSLVVLSVLFGLASAVPIYPYLRKRESTVVIVEKPAVLGTSNLSVNSITVVANTAKSLQLSTLGLQPMTANEWVTYGNELQTRYMSQAVSYETVSKDRLVAPAAGVFIVSILLAVLVPLVGMIFCCCRLRGKCGGRKPLKSYTKLNLWYNVLSMLLLSIICVSIASLSIVYTKQLQKSVSDIEASIRALSGDMVQFTSGIQDGVTSSPDLAVDSIENFVDNLLSINYNQKLSQTVDVAVNLLISDLSNLAINVNQIRLLANSTRDAINASKSTAAAIKSDLNTVQTDLNNKQTMTVGATTYNLPNFPDISSTSGSGIPDISTPAEMDNFLNQVNSIQDPQQYLNELNTTYYDFTRNLTAQMNDTIRSNLPDTRSQADQYVETVNSTLGSLRSTISTSSESYLDEYMPIVNQITGIIKDVITAEMAVILTAVILVILGIIFRKHKLMVFFPILVVLISFIIWLEFLIFWIVAVPFNAGCDSMPKILNEGYSIPMTVPGWDDANLSPAMVLSGCTSGRNLFSLPVNYKNESFTSVATGFVNSDLIDSLNSLFSNDTLADLVSLPNATSDLNSISGSPGVNFNFTSLHVNNSVSINLASLVNDLQTWKNGLAPSNLDANNGNMTLLNEKIADFNALVTIENANFIPWNYTYIRDRYIIPNDPFQVSHVSSDPSDTHLATDFNTNVRPRAQFIYDATAALNSYRTSLVSSENDLLAINDKVASLNGNLTNINENINMLDTYSQLTANNVTKFINDFPELDSQIKEFIGWVAVQAKNALVNNLNDFVETFLANNPQSTFGECKMLAQNTVYLLDSVCYTMGGSVSVLWFCFVMIGTLFIFGLIFSMKAKKRIEYMHLRNKVEHRGKSNTNVKKGEKTEYFDDRTDYTSAIERTAEIND